jgi:hypothetical protein
MGDFRDLFLQRTRKSSWPDRESLVRPYLAGVVYVIRDLTLGHFTTPAEVKP